MDRNDDDEYAEPDGVDPEWNPFSTPRSLDDGPGWDDGSPHAGGVSRMPKRLIVVITIVTLIVAVVSIGLVVTESNMSVHRHQLASACETAVAEMGQARERLDGQVAERFRTIDLQALSKRQKHEYESLRKVAKPVSIDCDASQRNSRLEENTRKATRATRRYARQSKQVAASPVRPNGLRRFTRTGRTRTVWPGISTRPGVCLNGPRAWNWWFLICVLGFRTRWPVRSRLRRVRPIWNPSCPRWRI